MAKDKPKEAADEEGAAPAPPKKSSMKLIIIGVVVLLAVGGGGAFAWFKFLAPHKVEAKTTEAKSSEAHGGEAKPGEPGAAATAKIGPILDLDPFIVNLADTEPRFLKVTIK